MYRGLLLEALAPLAEDTVDDDPAAAAAEHPRGPHEVETEAGAGLFTTLGRWFCCRIVARYKGFNQ